MSKKCLELCTWVQYCEAEREKAVADAHVVASMDAIIGREAVLAINEDLEAALIDVEDASSIVLEYDEGLDDTQLRAFISQVNRQYFTKVCSAMIGCDGIGFLDKIRYRNKNGVYCSSANVTKADKEIAFKKFA